MSKQEQGAVALATKECNCHAERHTGSGAHTGNQQPGQRPKIHPTWGADASLGPIWRKCHHMRAHIQLLEYASFSLRARYENPAHLERLLSDSLCCFGKAILIAIIDKSENLDRYFLGGSILGVSN